MKTVEVSAQPRMERLDLKVGYACINDCKFCVVADKRKYGEKTTQQIKQELVDSYREGRREIVFTGGECTIREDILEIVSFAKEVGYLNIQIQTNGRTFSSFDFAKKMVLAGMTEFGPALHGPTAEIHDSLTRRPGSWRQTVLGIHNVKKLGIRTLANVVITKPNYKSLPELASLFVKLKIDQFQFAFVHILGNARQYYTEVVPRVSAVAPYVKKGLDIGIKAGLRVMVEAIPFCLMKDYEKYLSEFFIPPTQVKEVGWQIDKFEETRKTQGKKKFLTCVNCKWYSLCEGPWKEYPELFGEKEFKPA
ncbi:MAG: radical SAM protein [Candidatus Omnitrophica bacterium]|nr:radical SAM protein [Candidatus Omnitrophota bacterium]